MPREARRACRFPYTSFLTFGTIWDFLKQLSGTSFETTFWDELWNSFLGSRGAYGRTDSFEQVTLVLDQMGRTLSAIGEVDTSSPKRLPFLRNLTRLLIGPGLNRRDSVAGLGQRLKSSLSVS